MGAANGNLDVSNASLQHFFTARDHNLCREAYMRVSVKEVNLKIKKSVVNWRLKRLSCRLLHPPSTLAKKTATF